ncbi:MAG: hypothetical protein IPG74_03310 [Flavobacteriales bacterium]|nr:hypothetical protein [Flavobacteriales bacterium]
MVNLKELRQRSIAPETAPVIGRVVERFVDRDISWLVFNERVLQEAQDPACRCSERVVLGIFSSNLDEFYRVRVAGLRSLSKLKKGERSALEAPAAKRVERINRKALAQQRRFGLLWRRTLLPALARAGIRFLGEGSLNKDQHAFVERWFLAHVAPLIHTAAIRSVNAQFIEELGRFLEVPAGRGRSHLMFLDDVIRLNLHHVFPGQHVLSCHSIKLSRDADLYLDEEFADSVVDKVRRSLKKRSTGVPARFLYDNEMPTGMVRSLSTTLKLKRADLVPGGRYHHFSDLLSMPSVGRRNLKDEAVRAVRHPALSKSPNLFPAVRKADLLLHFPYHDFSVITDWLHRAARDPAVTRIFITLYRVAKESEVCKALLEALKRGKLVTAFVEVPARFDERSNLYWGGNTGGCRGFRTAQL